MRVFSPLTAAAIGVLLLTAVPARAQTGVIRPEVCFPPPCSAFNAAGPTLFPGANAVLRGFLLTQFCDWAPPGPPGADVFVSTLAVARGELSLNGGSTFTPFETTSTLGFRIRTLTAPGPVQIIETELVLPSAMSRPWGFPRRECSPRRCSGARRLADFTGAP